jgi:tRNA pseudouridine55 synthase
MGETPLECLERFRNDNPEYRDQTLTYLGRLDPLAHGVLLVGVGKVSQLEREAVMKLDKTYKVEAVLGFSTDTYDILGLVEKVSLPTDEIKEKTTKVLSGFIGQWQQPYPPYSSKPVNGKPLFTWAREAKLAEIKIPTKEVEIKKIDLLDFETVLPEKLRAEIENKIALVTGDFRQAKIIAKWRKVLKSTDPNQPVIIVSFRAEVTSGTYVRALVNRLGRELGYGAVALGILRERVGKCELVLKT